MSLTNQIANIAPELVNNQWAFRNRMINGSCNISQRPSFVASTGLNGYGGPDRYLASNGNSAGGQFTQSAGTISYLGLTHNAVVQTVNTAIVSSTTTNYWYGVTQRIEGFNSYDLLGQPVTVSFIFETNVTGVYSFVLKDSTPSSTYVTTFSATANIPNLVVLQIPNLPLSLVVPTSNATGLLVQIGALNTGTYQTSTPNTWQSGNYFTASGTTNWGAAIGNFISLTNLQLEPGLVATPFENRPYSVELALCQRYYETGYISMQSAAVGFIIAPESFHATKRTTPTITYSGTAYVNAIGLTANAIGYDMIGFQLQVTSANGYVNSAFAASAEL